MDKKKIFDEWKDAKKVKNKSIDSEQAATLQESEDDPIPAFARPTDYKSSKKKNKLKPFKPIIVATISAIAIGSILGVIMLRMFVDMESDLAENNNLPAAHIDTADEENNNAETAAVAHGQIDAYVLQGGMFSNKKNADEWATKYEEAGLPNLIWKKENHYFLLVGLAGTKEQGKEFANEMEEYEFDIYVKEWSTSERETELTNEEHEWLQSFHENWKKSIESLGNEEVFSVDGWEALIENHPEDSENLAGLKETISSSLQSMEQAGGLEAQYILLNLWQQYSEV